MFVQGMTNCRQTQRGTALAIALVLLLIMSLLGVSIMQVSGLQERMAGNSSDRARAFQGAEAALSSAEGRLRDDEGFYLDAMDSVNGVVEAQSLQGLLSDEPTYTAMLAMRQRLVDRRQGLEIGSDLRFRCIFQVDARSSGGTNQAQVRLRSYFQPRPECEL
ncbi:pilus assembly PilX family protein [Halomonas alimentaria]|uniref:Type 4 fimbrial biogenesis protein PilX N-terminal domain-containing protein n=1 Tax=Halomonas alimentaria TaxID=147248 RepID=A0A7X4W4F9_9GAMM|nr:PilX N-terminal domain-containing pilus assembly protein [Halomonas alimentaria]NAW33271.1 hypothetical protein [Halomonas alimentaria]